MHLVPAALPEDLQAIRSSFDQCFSTAIKGTSLSYLKVILPYCPTKGFLKIA